MIGKHTGASQDDAIAECKYKASGTCSTASRVNGRAIGSLPLMTLHCITCMSEHEQRLNTLKGSRPMTGSGKRCKF